MVSKKKVLLATDFSEASVHAVDFAKWMLSQGNIELTILHVFDSSALYMPAPYYFIPEQERWMDDKVVEFKEKGEKALKDLANELGSKVDTLFLEGKPKTEIVSYSKEGNFDLVIIGSHGHSGLSRWVLGSVAEYVVRNADCGVLTIKNNEE